MAPVVPSTSHVFLQWSLMPALQAVDRVSDGNGSGRKGAPVCPGCPFQSPPRLPKPRLFSCILLSCLLIFASRRPIPRKHASAPTARSQAHVVALDVDPGAESAWSAPFQCHKGPRPALAKLVSQHDAPAPSANSDTTRLDSDRRAHRSSEAPPIASTGCGAEATPTDDVPCCF